MSRKEIEAVRREFPIIVNVWCTLRPNKLERGSVRSYAHRNIHRGSIP